MSIQIFDPPDPFVKLPALAERLGVEPIGPAHEPTIVLTTGSKSYDLFELVNAALDKLENR